MQIQSKRDLVTNYVHRASTSDAAACVAVLILELVIREDIERTTDRVGHIRAGKPIRNVLCFRRSCCRCNPPIARISRREAPAKCSRELLVEISRDDVGLGSGQDTRSARYAVIVARAN